MATASLREARTARFSIIVLMSVALVLSLLSGAGAAPIRWEVISPNTVHVASVSGNTQPDLAVSGQALVELQPGISNAALLAALQARGCDILHRYRISNLALVQFPANLTVPEGLAVLQQVAGVQKTHPNRAVYFLAVPNDPLYSQQYQWPLISAPAGWDKQTGSASTVVAIIDSGIQFTHPDLAAKIWTNPQPGSDPAFPNDLHGWNFVDGNNDPEPVLISGGTNEGASHGTHVAGLVGASTNNGVGVAGMDWHCQLMAVKVGDADGGIATSNVIAGIDYAVEKGANVINMSLGGGYDDVWTAPITAAFNAGVVVVCAAGNSSVTFTDDPSTWFSPVCNDGPNPGDNHVLGVAACDRGKVIATYSNLDASSHRFVDVVAPGGSTDQADILSTLPVFSGAAGFSSYYGYESGTSMASPIAAGLAALVHAQFPSDGPSAIMGLIRNGCSNLDAVNPTNVGHMGGGLINVVNSLTDLPPHAATNVQAFPTPNSPGSSITVTWNASPDDGAGYGNVGSYSVMQAPGPGGPFTKVGTVNATGVASYTFVNSPVTDGTPYWYRVDTLSADHDTFSAVAGPARSRDTIAPPQVTTLTVMDTPSDNGGAITLDWAGYAGTSNLASFRIYRALSSFTDVSAMTPLVTLPNPSARSYIDHTTTDGVNYWYAVTGVDSLTNENTTVIPAGPVQSSPNLTLTFPRDSSGLAMISLPLEPLNDDIGVILNATKLGFHIARYDPSSQSYAQYELTPDAPILRQVLGRGFWVQSAAPLVVSLGGQAAPAGDASVDFSPGWNMLGDPYTAAVTLGTASVTTAGMTESLDVANQNGHTANYAWYYDTTTRGYKLISSHLAGATTTVGSGLGMWFFANVAGELTLVRPAGALQVAPPAAAPTPTADNWSLRLVARTSGATDTDNFAGVSPQAASLNGVAKPPLLPGGVNLFFGPGGNSTPTATSFVTAAAQNPTWDLGVASAAPGTVVTVAWPDLTTVPNSLRPVLTDLATGTSVYMRTTAAYQFTSGTQPRRFRLSLAGGAGVTLTSVTALATAGGGAQITYALAAPAQVSADILNLSGALIRTVSAGTLSPAGLSTLVWDGRNASGSAVPAGLYLVRLTVASDSGERTTALRSLSVSR